MSTLVVNGYRRSMSRLITHQHDRSIHPVWVASRPTGQDFVMAQPSRARLIKAVGVQGCGRNDDDDLPIDPGPYRVQSSTWS